MTYTVGKAVERAAEAAQQKLLAAASEELEIGVGDLEVVDGVVRAVGAPDRSISVEEIAKKALRFGGRYEPIEGHGGSAQTSLAPSVSAHLAHVRVDRETGEVELLEYVIVQDVGRALNPALVGGQMRGGAVQAIGWALFEELVHDEDGQLPDGIVPRLRHPDRRPRAADRDGDRRGAGAGRAVRREGHRRGAGRPRPGRDRERRRRCHRRPLPRAADDPAARVGGAQRREGVIAAVILAAGEASRFGSPKQQLMLDGILQRVRASAVDEIVVVSGAYELETDATVVPCPDWANGPGASLRCGLDALPAEAEAAVVVLADGPDLAPRRSTASSTPGAPAPATSSPRPTAAFAAIRCCSAARSGTPFPTRARERSHPSSSRATTSARPATSTTRRNRWGQDNPAPRRFTRPEA